MDTDLLWNRYTNQGSSNWNPALPKSKWQTIVHCKIVGKFPHWLVNNFTLFFVTEFHCQYGNLTLRNNENWSGELCGGVVRCKDGITTVTKCPDIPPKPDDCARPRLIVKHQKGKCCQMKWKCKGKQCHNSSLKLITSPALSRVIFQKSNFFVSRC